MHSRNMRCSSRLMGSGMPDPGFDGCDGHHEMVDLRLTNPLAVEPDGPEFVAEAVQAWITAVGANPERGHRD
jgi:hypothetical protein